MLKVKKEIRREYFEGKTMSWEVVKEMEDKANETGELLCVVIGNSIVINSSYYSINSKLYFSNSFPLIIIAIW